MTIDPALFRATLAQWASGVSIVTTLDGDRPHGMTVSSFTSLSLEPSLIQFSVAKKSYTHQLIEQSGVFVVNILQEQQKELGQRFSGRPPEGEDRFEGIPYSIAMTGAPIIDNVNAWLDCRLYRTYDGGDHSLFIGEVVAAAAQPIEEPLLYFNRHWGTFDVSKSKTRLSHIVMMRLHEPTPENLHLLRSQLLSLQTTIPQIRDIEVGINVVPSDRAYDLVLITRFDSLSAMQEYQVHPDHQRVLAEIIRPYASSIVAVDFEDVE
jgi:flavin reductase (DIM6/NTAB) family NADH-FMN oxidoreductase RutF